jgi:ketosteroid isomerase-like protein
MRLLVLAAALLLNPSSHNLTDSPKTTVIPVARFIDDMRGKNIDDVLSLYTPDAVFVDPEGHQFVRPQALRKLYEQVFATYDSDLTFFGFRTVITGSYGSETVQQAGFYSEDLRTRSTGTVQHVCGGYHVTYKHQSQSGQQDRQIGDLIRKPASSWLISRQEWTSAPCFSPTIK